VGVCGRAGFLAAGEAFALAFGFFGATFLGFFFCGGLRCGLERVLVRAAFVFPLAFTPPFFACFFVAGFTLFLAIAFSLPPLLFSPLPTPQVKGKQG
jgi:hypothetical protein